MYNEEEQKYDVENDNNYYNQNRQNNKVTSNLLRKVYQSKKWQEQVAKYKKSKISKTISKIINNKISIGNFPWDSLEEYNTLIIQGDAGMGKTSLAENVVHQWANRNLWADKFDYVFIVYAKDINIENTNENAEEYKAISNAFKNFLSSSDGLGKFKNIEDILHDKNHHAKILLIIDGYDEATSTIRHNINYHILNNVYLSKIKKIVTTRPEIIPAVSKKYFYNIEGLEDDEINSYVDENLKNGNKLKLSIKDNLKKGNNGVIRYLKNPYYLSLICKSKIENLENLKIYKLYEELIERNVGKPDISDIKNKLQKFAYDFLMHKKPITSIGEKLKATNLLKSVKEIKDNESDEQNIDYAFKHQVLTEHLTAKYIIGHIDNLEIRKTIILKREDPQYLNLFKILASIVRENKENQEKFWQLMASPLEAQIKYNPLGVDEFFMHLLAAYDGNEYYKKRLDNSDTIIDNIYKKTSEIIEKKPIAYASAIKNSGYMNDKIKEKLFSIISKDSKPEDIETALDILENVRHEIPLCDFEQLFKKLTELTEGNKKNDNNLSNNEQKENYEYEEKQCEEIIKDQAEKPRFNTMMEVKENKLENTPLGENWRIEFYKLELLDRLLIMQEKKYITTLKEIYAQIERSNYIGRKVKIYNIMLKHFEKIDQEYSNVILRSKLFTELNFGVVGKETMEILSKRVFLLLKDSKKYVLHAAKIIKKLDLHVNQKLQFAYKLIELLCDKKKQFYVDKAIGEINSKLSKEHIEKVVEKLISIMDQKDDELLKYTKKYAIKTMDRLPLGTLSPKLQLESAKVLLSTLSDSTCDIDAVRTIVKLDYSTLTMKVVKNILDKLSPFLYGGEFYGDAVYCVGKIVSELPATQEYAEKVKEISLELLKIDRMYSSQTHTEFGHSYWSRLKNAVTILNNFDFTLHNKEFFLLADKFIELLSNRYVQEYVPERIKEFVSGESKQCVEYVVKKLKEVAQSQSKNYKEKQAKSNAVLALGEIAQNIPEKHISSTMKILESALMHEDTRVSAAKAIGNYASKISPQNIQDIVTKFNNILKHKDVRSNVFEAMGKFALISSGDLAQDIVSQILSILAISNTYESITLNNAVKTIGKYSSKIQNQKHIVTKLIAILKNKPDKWAIPNIANTIAKFECSSEDAQRVVDKLMHLVGNSEGKSGIEINAAESIVKFAKILPKDYAQKILEKCDNIIQDSLLFNRKQPCAAVEIIGGFAFLIENPKKTIKNLKCFLNRANVDSYAVKAIGSIILEKPLEQKSLEDVITSIIATVDKNKYIKEDVEEFLGRLDIQEDLLKTNIDYYKWELEVFKKELTDKTTELSKILTYFEYFHKEEKIRSLILNKINSRRSKFIKYSLNNKKIEFIKNLLLYPEFTFFIEDISKELMNPEPNNDHQISFFNVDITKSFADLAKIKFVVDVKSGIQYKGKSYSNNNVKELFIQLHQEYYVEDHKDDSLNEYLRNLPILTKSGEITNLRLGGKPDLPKILSDPLSIKKYVSKDLNTIYPKDYFAEQSFEKCKVSITSLFAVREIIEHRRTIKYFFKEIIGRGIDTRIDKIIDSIEPYMYYTGGVHLASGMIAGHMLFSAHDPQKYITVLLGTANYIIQEYITQEFTYVIHNTVEDEPDFLRCVGDAIIGMLFSSVSAMSTKLFIPQASVNSLKLQILSTGAVSFIQCYNNIHVDVLQHSWYRHLLKPVSIFELAYLYHTHKSFKFDTLASSIISVKNIFTVINIINFVDMSIQLPLSYLAQYENDRAKLEIKKDFGNLGCEYDKFVGGIIGKKVICNQNYTFTKKENINDLIYIIADQSLNEEGNESSNLHESYCSFIDYLNNNRGKYNIINFNKANDALKEYEKSCDQSMSDKPNQYNMKGDKLVLPKIKYNKKDFQTNIHNAANRNKTSDLEKCLSDSKYSKKFKFTDYISSNENIDLDPFGCIIYSKIIPNIPIKYPWLSTEIFQLMNTNINLRKQLSQFCQIPKTITLACGKIVHIDNVTTMMKNLKAYNPKFDSIIWKNIIKKLHNSITYVDEEENGCKPIAFEYDNYCQPKNKILVRLLESFSNEHLGNKDSNKKSYFVPERNEFNKKFIKKTMSGMNEFLFSVGNVFFSKIQKEVIHHVWQWGYSKDNDFNNVYCSMIDDLRLQDESCKNISDLIREQKKLDNKQSSNIELESQLEEVSDKLKRLESEKQECEKKHNIAGINKFIYETRKMCESSKTIEPNTPYNMVIDEDEVIEYTERKPRIDSDDDELIKFISNLTPDENYVQCQNKSYFTIVENSCIGFDKVHKISLKYPWLNKKICNIDDIEINKLQKKGADQLKEYQQKKCIATDVILGSKMAMEINNQKPREEEEFMVVLGYMIENLCTGKNHPVHDEL